MLIENLKLFASPYYWGSVMLAGLLAGQLLDRVTSHARNELCASTCTSLGYTSYAIVQPEQYCDCFNEPEVIDAE